MIVFRAPKGWTGPKSWDGDKIEGSFRAHQIPIPVDQNDMEHADALVDWLESYQPKELFNEDGSLKDDIKEIIPTGDSRMAANPITNGGVDPKALNLPNFRDYAVDTSKEGANVKQDMIVWSDYLRDVIKKILITSGCSDLMKPCLTVYMVSSKPLIVNGWKTFIQIVTNMKHQLAGS